MSRLLNDAEIDAALASLAGWAREGIALVKVFDCADFDGSIAFVNTVAATAHKLDHHPYLAIDWNRVTVRTWSHDLGGITQRDFALARAIDAI